MSGELVAILACGIDKAIFRALHHLDGFRIGHIIEVTSHDDRQVGCVLLSKLFKELLNLELTNLLKTRLCFQVRSVNQEISTGCFFLEDH